jgi:hypothetical protein
MSGAGAKCPYCDVFCEFDLLSVLTINKFGWINCRNCGQLLKVIFEKPGLYDTRLEKYTSLVSFGEFYPKGSIYSIYQYYLYSEPSIPEAVCQELKKIMIGIKVNLKTYTQGNKTFQNFKDPDSEKWVVENLVPKIIPIYNQYPFQINQIMDRLYVDALLDPYMIVCSYCGFRIPEARKDDCPVCANGKNPPNISTTKDGISEMSPEDKEG